LPGGGTVTVLRATVPERLSGERLDRALAVLFPQHSRSRLQQWIRAGHVSVAGSQPRPRDAVTAGDEVVLRVPCEPAGDVVRPQPIPLDVVYEDESVLVIDKPAGMVVHPGAGNPDGTLQNALLDHAPELRRVPRAGIVHRLDKDTTGLLVVARTPEAHTRMVAALQAREMHREYDAIVIGRVIAGGTLEAPIGRHPVDRVRMAVRRGGRPAVTHYRVRERYRAHTRLRVWLETGRTHQIRVHLAHAGHPVLGDPVYGGRLRLPAGAGAELAGALRAFRRQALHAARLALAHPATGELVTFEAPPPPDMQRLVEVLRCDAQSRPA